MTKALLFDALGTLVALQPPAPRLRANLLERLGIEISEAQAEDAIAAEISYYRSHLGEGRDPETLADLRRRCAEAMGAALPSAVRLPGTDALVELLLASLEFRAFDDVRPALQAAREGDRRLVVVSNWDISLRDVLGRVGLAPLLDGVVVSAEVGAAKPAAAIFEHALGVARAGPADAVHVGDSPIEDIQGARAAGIEPIFISRNGAPGPPGVRTIRNLAELARARFEPSALSP